MKIIGARSPENASRLIKKKAQGLDPTTERNRRLYGINSASLVGADFRNVDLRGKDLSGQDLSGANFEGLDLSDTKFNGANLVRANFKNTKITNSSFERANLENADFHDSKIENTSFAYANMKKVGLENVMMYYPLDPFANVRLDSIAFYETELDQAQLTHLDIDNFNHASSILINGTTYSGRSAARYLQSQGASVENIVGLAETYMAKLDPINRFIGRGLDWATRN